MSINKALISGNLTRDAELNQTRGGTAVCKFGVAVNERRKNQNGEWEDYANFVDCVLWGRRAEAIAQYLTKGTKVFVDGSLSYSSWEDKSGGGKRSKLEVKVDEIEFASIREGNAGGYSKQRSKQGGYQQQAAAAYADADIPF